MPFGLGAHRLLAATLAAHDKQTAAGTDLVGCHPARITPDLVSSYTPEREVELATLTEPGLRSRIEDLGFALASYHDWRASK